MASPLRRFSSELLSEIFLQTPPNDWEYQIRPYRRAVLLPGQICRKWRSVALSTGLLWLAICVILSEYFSFDLDTALVINWLERSNRFPVSLKLVACQKLPYSISPILDALLAYSTKWRHAQFTIPFSIWPGFFTWQNNYRPSRD